MGDDRLASLTNREREVVRLIARNRGDSQIAELLHVSVHTVRAHVKNARAKVGGCDKYYLADALGDLEGRSPSLASPKFGIAATHLVAADEPISAVGTAPLAINVVREERATFESVDGPATPSRAREVQGKNDDLRTLTIICLVFAIALLIALTFIYAKPLANAFQEWADHLHQIR